MTADETKLLKQLHDAMAALDSADNEKKSALEQREQLTQSINVRLGTVQVDDDDGVARLAQDRVKLELFPNKLKRLDEAIAKAMAVLDSTIDSGRVLFGKYKSEQYHATYKRLKEFFQRELYEEGRADTLAHEFTPRTKVMIEAERDGLAFGSITGFSGKPNAVVLLSAARRIIDFYEGRK